MMPTAGSINTPCTLAVRTVIGKDAAGKDKVDYVDQAGNVWIALRKPKANEVDEHDRKSNRVVWDAFSHFRDDLHADGRLTSGSRVFYIDGEPVDPYGERKELHLTLVEEIG